MSDKCKDKYQTLDSSHNEGEDVTEKEEVKEQEETTDDKSSVETKSKTTKNKSNKKPFAFITKLRSYVPRNNYKTVEEDDEMTSRRSKKAPKEVVADGE